MGGATTQDPLIVPATLRKQWQIELEDKFFLPSLILETKSLNELIKKGAANPFAQSDRIVICSYQFVYAKRAFVQNIDRDLVVIDEVQIFKINFGRARSRWLMRSREPTTATSQRRTPR